MKKTLKPFPLLVIAMLLITPVTNSFHGLEAYTLTSSNALEAFSIME